MTPTTVLEEASTSVQGNASSHFLSNIFNLREILKLCNVPQAFIVYNRQCLLNPVLNWSPVRHLVVHGDTMGQSFGLQKEAPCHSMDCSRRTLRHRPNTGICYPLSAMGKGPYAWKIVVSFNKTLGWLRKAPTSGTLARRSFTETAQCLVEWD